MRCLRGERRPDSPPHTTGQCALVTLQVVESRMNMLESAPQLNPARVSRPQRPPGAACGKRRPADSALRVKHRNRKVEFRTHSQFTLDPNAPAHNFNQMLRNRESQTGTPGFARSRHIDAVKTLKNPRLIGFRGPHSRGRHGAKYFV